jgi:hypothetical protein
MLGLGGRAPIFILLQLWLAIIAIHPTTGGGHDRLFSNGLWLLVLGPSTATMSLDCRLRSGSWVDLTPVPAWTRYLLVLQLVLMYTVTGLAKQGPSWGAAEDYRALYYSLLLPSWQKMDLTWIAHVFPLTQLGTIVAWWWEASWGLVLLWFLMRARRPSHPGVARYDVRALYVGVGLVTHGVLWFTMNLGPFSAITMAYYVVLWNHAEWTMAYQRVVRAVRGVGFSRDRRG